MPWAYQIPVKQHFRSSFGDFSVHQDVFVIRENGDWKLLWSFE
ncbi:hypothetical protein [Paenibacillus sp. EPM92]|nr:hypothetical protein [Paenibacillus sp. EPM92]